MTRKIADMRNLGPATARMLAEVDVADEETLRAIGAAAAYRRLKFRFGRRVTLVALYALEGALRDCDWRSFDVRARAELAKAAAGSIKN